ncbi:response regulator transcription factor [Kribbella sp. NPDC058245]|uniref:response regulator transcription factor n=1 Tax=Kribbella sp. NPDC058245 TaxID=3346399 RepID=UPI0036F12214
MRVKAWGLVVNKTWDERLDCCCTSNRLTERELEVLTLVATGLSDEEIGHKLHVSRHTVGYQVSNALRRCAARNRTEIVSRCYACGVFTAGRWPPKPTGWRCLSHCDSLTPLAVPMLLKPR